MDAYERPSCTNFCVRRKNKALRVFTSARGANEDNWSSRWRFADYGSTGRARAIRPAIPGGTIRGRTSLRKRTKRLTSHRSPTRPPHAAAGHFHTIHHGRTTKKNSGSSTPIATDPIYMPFFQSLHRSRPPTALEKMRLAGAKTPVSYTHLTLPTIRLV